MQHKARKVVACLLSALLVCLVVCTPVSVSAEPALYNGIDVSEWQGSIDYAKVKADGIQVVYIRASLGDNYIDPYFRQNYEGAKAQGLLVGFYHYVTATTVEQARQEARFFVSVISGTKPDCRLAMDFEYFSGLGTQQINQIALAFLETLQKESDKDVCIYSDAYNTRATFGPELAKYPLWVAEYGVSSPNYSDKWSDWAGWQYTDSGRVNGISGNVDRDYYKKQIFQSGSSEIPKPGGNTGGNGESGGTGGNTGGAAVTYTVRRGDTLWGIAQRYRTTVAAIVQANGIQNPNRIYPGEAFKIPTSGSTGGNTGGAAVTYTVRRGDTLWGIAQRYRTTVCRLVGINKIKNPGLIYPGQSIKICT